MDFRAFGLLRLDENQKTAMNFSSTSFREQISVYINNAIVLSRTLEARGIDFALLTNHKSLVEDIALEQEHGFSLVVHEIPFTTEVPSGVRFYSAHYKLDAFRYLATAKSGYLALCDLDMVCANPIPVSLENLVEARIPLHYDISDQVIPAYGREPIVRDLGAIHGLDSEGRWSGGEFISGPPEFFSDLVDAIEDIYGSYVSRISSLHHVGDEAFTSSALEVLRRKGRYIADAGTLGIVGRYWNTPTLHPQKPFEFFRRCFLLHLPADKKFLSDLARRDSAALSDFKSRYDKHRRSLVVMLRKGALSGRRLLRSLAKRRPSTTPSWNLSKT